MFGRKTVEGENGFEHPEYDPVVETMITAPHAGRYLSGTLLSGLPPIMENRMLNQGRLICGVVRMVPKPIPTLIHMLHSGWVVGFLVEERRWVLAGEPLAIVRYIPEHQD